MCIQLQATQSCCIKYGICSYVRTCVRMCVMLQKYTIVPYCMFSSASMGHLLLQLQIDHDPTITNSRQDLTRPCLPALFVSIMDAATGLASQNQSVLTYCLNYGPRLFCLMNQSLRTLTELYGPLGLLLKSQVCPLLGFP